MTPSEVLPLRGGTLTTCLQCMNCHPTPNKKGDWVIFRCAKCPSEDRNQKPTRARIQAMLDYYADSASYYRANQESYLYQW